MLLSKACKEVLEGVLLFMVHQYGHLSTLTTRRLQPRAFLTIFTEETTEVVTWSVRVDASDLGVYFLDGKLFLNKLCSYGSDVNSVLNTPLGGGGGERGELVVLSRRIGDYATVQRHTAACLSCDGTHITSSDVVVEERVVPRPSNFPPSGLRLCFQGRCTLGEMKKEAHTLSVHMYYLHLINPSIELGLLVKANSQVLVASQFSREPGWHPLSTSPHTLITSLHHYTSAATKQSKLRLSRGTSFTLQPLTLRNGSQITLKLYCSAGVVPHLSLRKGRKIPANRTCQRLQVYVFGPGCLPVVDPGSLSSLSLCSLADWESYGLSLTQAGANAESSENSEVSSGWCRLSDNRAVAVNSNPCRRSKMSCHRSLVLFVFLEDTDTTGNPGAVGHCTTHYWGQQMDRVHEQRDMLAGLLQSQKKKFKQATHSVLNKLLCNYGTHIKTASILHSTLPLLADAVASVIRKSSNDQFKQRCRSILQLPNGSEEEKESISEKLWEIAEKQLHISKAQTTFPQEPPSPELEQAASEDSPPTTTDAAPTTNSRQTAPTTDAAPTTNSRQTASTTDAAPTTNSRQTASTTDAAPTTNSRQRTSTSAHEAALDSCDVQTLGGEGDKRGQSHHQQSSESDADSRKYSLFQAMINSKRAKRRVTISEDTTNTSLLSGSGPCESHSPSERSSFDALAELLEERDDQDTQSHENRVSAVTKCTTMSSPSSHPNMQLSSTPTSEDNTTCFEDLAAVDAEEDTILSSQASVRNAVQMSCEDSTRLWCDDDSATDMDWGDETDGGEFDNLDAGFSDFSTSVNESEDENGMATQEEVKRGTEQQCAAEYCIEEQTGLTRAGQEGMSQRDSAHTFCGRNEAEDETEHSEHNSISFLNHMTTPDTTTPHTSYTKTHHTTPILPSLLQPVCSIDSFTSTVGTNATSSSFTQYDCTTTDSAWEQLGELMESDVETRYPSQPASVKVVSQLETAIIGSVSATVTTSSRAPPPTVPDISNCSCAMDIISEDDFLWD